MTSAEKVIEILDANIRMFEGFTKTSRILDTLSQLRDARNEVMDLIEGKVEYTMLSWNARDWFQEMPEWGTYGT